MQKYPVRLTVKEIKCVKDALVYVQTNAASWCKMETQLITYLDLFLSNKTKGE